jgi:hypothetical protein
MPGARHFQAGDPVAPSLEPLGPPPGHPDQPDTDPIPLLTRGPIVWSALDPAPAGTVTMLHAKAEDE